jgi:Signal recognition particle receptor beta subunit
MSYGPLEPHLKYAALSLANWMRSHGLTPPREPLLIPALLITILTLLLGAGFVATLFLAQPRSARDTVLIVGASPASTVSPAPGKTTLFHVLRAGHSPPFGTVPSQVANEAVFAPSAALRVADPASEEAERQLTAPVRWVDFPGHARLRPELADYLTTARAIIFVLDASPIAFSRTLRESGDLLYDVLTHRVVVKNATPLLLFCNKKDLPSVVPPADICARLEAEIERARKAKAAALSGAQNYVVTGPDTRSLRDDDERPALGYDNEEFKFEHIPNKVVTAAGSAKLLDVSAVCNFVAEHF